MRLYNTLTRSDEEFAPADGRTVRMYTCGLTVYARGHIGNFRTFVCLDILRRALEHQEGYAVRPETNFTDGADKTIRASAEAGASLREYKERYIDSFGEDDDRAGRAHVGFRLRPRAPRLAHRVLGDGAPASRRAAHRHPRRRHRSHLSAPRERDRAGGGRHRPAVRALVGARRVPEHRQP